jgi:hypothetical protein
MMYVVTASQGPRAETAKRKKRECVCNNNSDPGHSFHKSFCSYRPRTKRRKGEGGARCSVAGRLVTHPVAVAAVDGDLGMWLVVLLAPAACC